MLDKFLYKIFGALDVFCESLAKMLESKIKKGKKKNGRTNTNN